MDVLDEPEEIRVPIAQDGLVPPLEKVADGAVSSIEVLGVGLVDALHDLGQRYIVRLDQEMDVVAHEDVCVDAAFGAVLIDGEGEEVLLKIRRVLEHPLFPVTAGDDVVEGSGKLDAGLSGHGARISIRGGDVKFA